MGDPAIDIAKLIDDAGLATFGTDLFVSRFSTDGGDEQVMVWDTGGDIPMTTLDKEVIRMPSVGVQVRGEEEGYEAAYALAEQIYEELHGQSEVTVNGSRYLIIMASSDIMFIGRDKSERPLFSLNFNTKRTESGTSSG